MSDKVTGKIKWFGKSKVSVLLSRLLALTYSHISVQSKALDSNLG